MSATGGYISDVNLNNVNLVGDFPIENSLGGVGTTTGATDDYVLALEPVLTEAYRVGLLLIVKFNHLNTGAATLNVDSKGAVSIRKITATGTLVDVTTNDLNTNVHYLLIYDGTYFQLVSGLTSEVSLASEVDEGILKIATQALTNAGTDDRSAITPLKLATLLNNKLATELASGLIQLATQAIVDLGTDDQRAVTPLKLQVKLDNFLNREHSLVIEDRHIGTLVIYNSGRNHYSVVNGNLVLVKDIRLKHSSGTGRINEWVLNFPKPLSSPTGAFAGTLLSTSGETFFYSIDSNGKVIVSGTFVDPNDELLFNIKPYLAQFPIVYHEVSPS